ncbi:hypothetical protein PVAP13_3NG140941 [Panicum virgatum]|uniref:Uncharacterized protein n=1 Tax=Panicum virgatum TaxID=38727 RepID=A0A8T0UE43_PANVG|nr:hypothetical protein PVAP13_3NG140941 [Panicum virgatum]
MFHLHLGRSSFLSIPRLEHLEVHWIPSSVHVCFGTMLEDRHRRDSPEVDQGWLLDVDVDGWLLQLGRRSSSKEAARLGLREALQSRRRWFLQLAQDRHGWEVFRKGMLPLSSP